MNHADNKSRPHYRRVIAGLAEIEHGHIRERQKAGIDAAKARGVYSGRAVGCTKTQVEHGN